MTAAMSTDLVDWLAVEFVCSGTRMRLADDRATLEAAIVAIGYRLTCSQIAERLGTNTRRVSRLLQRMGATPCPSCNRYVICDDGVLPCHVLSDGLVCSMSGYRADDIARRDAIRAEQRQVRSFV